MFKIFFICFWSLFAIHAQSEHRENDYRGTGAPRFRVIKELNASASGQYSKDQLSIILANIVNKQNIHPQLIYVIDLREEAHLFADGIPFTITDQHENPSKSYWYEKENELLEKVRQFKVLTIEPRMLDRDVKEYYERKYKHLPKEYHPRFLKRNKHRFWINKAVTLKSPIVQTEEEVVKKLVVN